MPRRDNKATTDSRHNLPVAQDLLQRNFSAAAPDSAWSSDITCIATAEGWLYLAVMIDLFSRRVVGWSMKRKRSINRALEQQPLI